MKNPDEFILGETNELIPLVTSEDNFAITIKLIDQCRRHLDIVSRDLDPCIYDTTEVINSLKKLALRSRYSRIRLLVLQPESVITRGHQLINLAEKLSSFIEIRKPGDSDKKFNQALLIADEIGYIKRKHSDQFAGDANFRGKKVSKKLDNKFEALWEHALPDPNFRRLMI